MENKCVDTLQNQRKKYSGAGRAVATKGTQWGDFRWTNLYVATEHIIRASLVAQSANNLPAVQQTQVQSLSREDALENRMATHSSILTWRIPWTEEPGRVSWVHGVAQSQT